MERAELSCDVPPYLYASPEVVEVEFRVESGSPFSHKVVQRSALSEPRTIVNAPAKKQCWKASEGVPSRPLLNGLPGPIRPATTSLVARPITPTIRHSLGDTRAHMAANGRFPMMGTPLGRSFTASSAAHLIGCNTHLILPQRPLGSTTLTGSANGKPNGFPPQDGDLPSGSRLNRPGSGSYQRARR